MDLEVSDKLKICGGGGDDDRNLNLKWVTSCEKNTLHSNVMVPESCKKIESDDNDDDNVPLSAKFSVISSLGGNYDGSVKKSPTTTLLVKRLFENGSSSCGSVKKSKVSPSAYDDGDDDEDEDVPISWRGKMPTVSVGKVFSVTKRFVEKKLALMEESIEECQRKGQVEEQKLESIKIEIEEYSKELVKKNKQVGCVRRIHEAHKKIQGKVEECVKDFVAKEAQLCMMENLIGERKQELNTELIELHEIIGNVDKDRERKQEELKVLSQNIVECSMELMTREKELDAMKKLIGEQAEILESERKKLLKVMSIRSDQRAQTESFELMRKRSEGQILELQSKEKRCEEQMMELESKKKHFERQVKELGLKEEKLEGQVKKFEAKEEELEGRMKELESEKKHFENRVKELESKEKLVEGRAKELQSNEKQLESRVKEFVSKEEKFEGQLKELEFRKKHFESQVKELESKDNTLVGQVKEFEGQVKELVSKQKHFESQMNELESKEKRLEGRLKEHESKEKEFEGQVKELESKKKELESKEKEFECQLTELVKELVSKQKHFVSRIKELESKEKQHDGRVKEHESKEREFEGQMKELESKKKHFKSQVEELKSKERQFKGQVKELESKEMQLDGQMKEFQSKEKQHEGRMKELESKEEKLQGQVKELESRKKHFESQVEVFKSKEKQFEGRGKEFELKASMLKVQVKELILKEKLLEGQVQDLESKLNKFDGQSKESESTEKRHEALIKYFDEEKESLTSCMDDQLCPTIDGMSLQLVPSEQPDGPEFLCNDVLVNLLESSDPSRTILDIILNPVIPLCKTGDDVVIIDESHIFLLEQLMKISPNIKPGVKEEALKLASDMKANMKENTENSLGVLGFLLVLSIYGLLASFDEGKVLELFAFVAHHKIAVELFGSLGFANKVSDFVENLIRKKQFVGAVRFSYAYNLADKKQLVDLLREHVQNAKLICENSCKKTSSIEIKDKARDEEIASLETVLLCISDNNLKSEELFIQEIQYRILELKAHKGK